MNHDGFTQYLHINKFMVKEPPYTHYLMNGGKLRVPREMSKDFLLKYSHYSQVNKLYVIELKTKVFCFLLDLDFYHKIGLPQHLLIKYIITIQKSIYNVLCNNHDTKECRTIVCLTKDKPETKNNEQYIKTGVHLYWPNVYVDKEHSLILRNIIINALEDTYGERGSHNTWEDVVDKIVLEQNGLRMIGSRKITNCSHCKTARVKISNCNICNGTGKQDAGRVYEPLCILDGKGKDMKHELVKINSNVYKKIQATSIRTEYTELPKVINIPEQYKVKTRITKKKKTNTDTNLFDIECDNKECLEKDGKIFKMCVKFIREKFPHTSKIDIIEIFKKGADNPYYIARTSSRYCMNINREHNSNHIYFYIDKSFVYQKCLCTCDTTLGRRFGKCENYKSSGRTLSTELQKVLFPQEKNKMAILVEIPVYDKKSSKLSKDKYVDNLQAYCDYLTDGLYKREQIEDHQIIK